MDLRSGRSLWKEKKIKIKYRPLRKDISCDVLIVGGGIIGALLAYKLSKDDLDVVLIEKNAVASGSTLASTALLVYGLDINLTDLIKMVGKEKAVRAYRLSLGSVKEIKKIIRELRIKDYRDKKTLYLASSRKDLRGLKKEYEALKKDGFKVRYIAKKELKEKFSIDKEGGIIYRDGGEVNPYKLTRELLRAARRRGVRIYENTEISINHKKSTNVDKDIVTIAGNKIKTGDLVYATGYESQNYLKQKLVDLKSSYVIASKTIPSLSSHFLKDYIVWETAKPYLYIRSTPDRKNYRIIVGGEDEDVLEGKKRDRLIPKKSKKLEDKFEKLIKNINFDTEYSWAGTFGETKDGLGYAGIPKGFKNIYFVLGFGGNGITSGVAAASLLRQMLLGEKQRNIMNKDLFSFDRLDHK